MFFSSISPIVGIALLHVAAASLNSSAPTIGMILYLDTQAVPATTLEANDTTTWQPCCQYAFVHHALNAAPTARFAQRVVNENATLLRNYQLRIAEHGAAVIGIGIVLYNPPWKSLLRTTFKS